LPTEGRLYGCPQSIYKFHPEFDAALAGILRRDAEGRVVILQAVYPQLDEQLRRRWQRVMPDVAERIVMVPRLEQDAFYKLLQAVDVLLDPFPYGGCTSSLEAFSFGVPVVTLPTRLLRGRFTQGFYQRLGVDSCIARDVGEYIELAVRLAQDYALRAEVSRKIIDGQGRLFEDAEAVRDWERFLKSVASSSSTI
jgi:predicted O-linked N-acetylglucosamine transferase (SPINDLY family)